jgi:hypothetical protein
VVVGTYGVAEGGEVPFAERWNGSGWSLEGLPEPAVRRCNPHLCGFGGPSVEMSGVSCASATGCVAVGNVGNKALVDGWNGTAWSDQNTPVPSGRPSGVSCVSATACVAVGSYRSHAGHALAFIERWDGTGWSTQTTPNPPGALTSTLTGVSCTSKTACTAVGRYTSASRTNQTLAERWNGTKWSRQQTGRPIGATRTSLDALSCPSPTTCVAVGSYTDATGHGRVLLERWTRSR